MEEADKAFLAPFHKIYESAREIEAKGEVLMRAALRANDPDDQEDRAVLRSLAELCFKEGRRLRDSVPVPS